MLKPGGVYVGTVSQGEPFHNSFFHLTPWGLLSLASTTESLATKKIWASRDTLLALATMGRYPKMISLILRFVNEIHLRMPILAPRKQRWTTKNKELDAIFRSGSLGYVIEKKTDNS